MLRVKTICSNSIKTFESITVLFVELDNIDITAENVMEMVNCMNLVFSTFDTITDRHSVYKVIFFFTFHAYYFENVDSGLT